MPRGRRTRAASSRARLTDGAVRSRTAAAPPAGAPGAAAASAAAGRAPTARLDRRGAIEARVARGHGHAGRERREDMGRGCPGPAVRAVGEPPVQLDARDERGGGELPRGAGDERVRPAQRDLRARPVALEGAPVAASGAGVAAVGARAARAGARARRSPTRPPRRRRDCPCRSRASRQRGRGRRRAAVRPS